jgi:hypothetical protein
MRTAHRPRLLGALLVGLGSLVASSLPAFAVAPANDSISTPVVVGVLPWTYSQDTSQATSSSSDGRCVFGSSVWYRYRPTTTVRRKLVTFGSDYYPVITLFRGPRNDRTFIKCSLETESSSALAYRFEAGRTYWIALSACCSRSRRGGNAVLTMYRGGTFSFTLSVDSAASGDVSGRAIVSGSVTCSLPGVVYPFVSISQRVGDNVARGSSGGDEDGEEGLVCGRDETAWSLTIDSDTGWAFQPGPAVVTTRAWATDGFGWFEQTAEPTVVTLTSAPNARPAP